MSETYSPAGNVGATLQRATVGEAATGTHGQEFMRDDITRFADKTRFLSDAGFYTASKVQFPATQVPDADPNALDDYEEGTFTPSVAFGGASVGITYSNRIGAYTKIGNVVFFTVTVVLSAKGSSVGSAAVAGLPFPASVSDNHVAGMAGSVSNFTGVTGIVQGALAPASSSILLQAQNNGGTTTIDDTKFTNTTQFVLTGTYKI
jgi:hypothetical protein